MSGRKVEICYPSFSKKALTFTIDDGDITNDLKFINIVRPYGIRGTFNLCSERTIQYGRDFYVSFYRGYEIANHCKYHPFVFFDGVKYELCEDEFDEATADARYIYRVAGKEGFYHFAKPDGSAWREVVSETDFIRYVDECREELNAIFGEGAVRDFVWPYGYQNNAAVAEHIRATHRSCRKTGCTLDTTGFAIPEDKYSWSYNANHKNLLEAMELYESYPDDGELKFFAFGVHSIDFERDSRWGDLSEFAEKYGGRPTDFWYATVGEIFDYDEAVKLLVISSDGVYNPSSLPIYIKVDGKREIVSPLGVVRL